MKTAKHVTHIVPVGFTPEKLIASIRHYPVHKVIIVTLSGDEMNDNVQATVNELTDSFKGIEIEGEVVARENLFHAVLNILDIAETEIKKGRTVMINISGGLRNIGISAYIASLVSGISIYTDIPDLSDSGEYMLKGILEIPSFPIKDLPKEQMDILQELGSGVDSQDMLITRLKPDLKKGSVEFNNERSRLSHHIKKLKKDGFVETEKKGRSLVIRMSVLGEIYVRGKIIKDLSSTTKQQLSKNEIFN